MTRNLRGCLWFGLILAPFAASGIVAAKIEVPADLPFEVVWANIHGDLTCVRFFDTRHGWAAGDDGVMLWTRDGGGTWEPAWMGERWRVLDLYFLDEKQGWAVVGPGYGSETPPALLHTSDGGINWKRVQTPALEDPRHVRFADAQTGWVIDTHAIVTTSDGGRSWNRTPTPPDLRVAGFFDAAHGWAFSEHKLHVTADRGATWAEFGLPMELPILGSTFFDANHGWISTYSRIYRTNDGGASWEVVLEDEKGYFGSLQFIDRAVGWCVADKVIHRTTDGGQNWESWTWTSPPEEWSSLNELRFIDRRRGWVVGDDGVILATTDGGITWRPQHEVSSSDELRRTHPDLVSGTDMDSDTAVRIQQVEFERHRYHLTHSLMANATTGWAVGSYMPDSESDPVGVIFSTTDGGVSWARQFVDDVIPGEIFFSPRELGYMRAGYSGSLLRAFLVNRAPSVLVVEMRESVTAGAQTRVEVRWIVRDERPDSVTCARLEVSERTASHFVPLDLKEFAKLPDGGQSVTFNPADYAIQPGPLHFRVTLRDDRGLAYAHLIPHSFSYRSWWDSIGLIGRVGVVTLAAIAAFYALCGGLLLVRPLTLVPLHDRLPVTALVAIVPNETLKTLVQLIVHLLGVGWMARHSRVRRAWLEHFRRDPGAIARTGPGLLQEFLGHPEGLGVWNQHYVAGHVTLEHVSPEIRENFRVQPAFLDAWVARRLGDARLAYEQIETVRQHEVFIDLPMRISDGGTENLLVRLTPDEFRGWMARDQVVVEIVGEGGSGKSTLAVQIGRWALAPRIEAGAGTASMIPVLLQEETNDLFAAVQASLRAMVGPEELDGPMLHALLEHRRVLVIVDSLSERTVATQRAVCQPQSTARFNAMVVTSRRAIAFHGRAAMTLRLEKVTSARLVYFVTEYLNRTDCAAVFPGREALQLCDRLMEAVERGTRSLQITPLFTTLFVKEAVAHRRSGQPLDRLPASIPEVIVRHLQNTNPKAPETPNRVDDEVLVRVARLLGVTSLGTDFVPREFFRDQAERALVESGLVTDGADPIRRLMDNGILEARDRGGTQLIRFWLDPIAEYLAALYWLDRLRGDRSGWEDWLHQLKQIRGFPAEIRGFLVALENGLVAYGRDFRIPDAIARELRELGQVPADDRA